MNDFVSKIPEIFTLNGGDLVGKTRIQKTFYFLEALDVGLGLDFQYYHYGPYSDELATSLDDAIALKVIEVEWKTGSHGYQYARLHALANVAITSDQNTTIKRQKILSILDRYDAISLELAATSDFLEASGHEDSWEETRIRKSSKASSDRLKKAKSLLSELRAIS